MSKMGMMLATAIALLGANRGWADEYESEEAVQITPATAAAVDSKLGGSEEQENCSHWSGRGNKDCANGECQSRFKSCGTRSADCNKNCGKACSLEAIREWLCFRREFVLCPKGPAPRVPKLYTFFPCTDCGDRCGHGAGCGQGAGCATGFQADCAAGACGCK